MAKIERENRDARTRYYYEALELCRLGNKRFRDDAVMWGKSIPFGEAHIRRDLRRVGIEDADIEGAFYGVTP